MSSQQPPDPSCQQVSQAPAGVPGGAGPAAPSEYVPWNAPPFPPQPLQRPAYLYPLLYTPVQVAPARQARWPAREFALTGLILDLAGTVLWLLPGLGDFISLLGLVFAILGWRRPTRRWMAILSCSLSAAALLLGLYDSALGALIFPH